MIFQIRLLFLLNILIEILVAKDAYLEAVRSFADVAVTLTINNLAVHIHDNDKRGIQENFHKPYDFIEQFSEDLFDLHDPKNHWKRQMFVTKKAGIARTLVNGSVVAGLVEMSYRDPNNLSERHWVKYDAILSASTHGAMKVFKLHRIERSKVA